MLEDQVAYLLQRYLGNYIRGLNREALKISVWKGDVELTKMQLKPEALNSLKLPLKVKAGFLGSVKIKVPWSRLGQEPVLVYLDKIYILAEPATQVEGCSEDAIQEAKKARVKEMEAKLLESWQQQKSEMSASWLGSLISTIIGNLKLSISNVHIRYEDVESNPGHPFAAGATLRRLSAVTVDDFGRETFATGGALEHIQKSVELESLALYFDSDIHPWNVDKPWEDLIPQEWTQMFELGDMDAKPSRSLLEEHSYVLQPVTGNARYVKLQPNESRELGQPLQKLTVNLDDVTLSLSKDGYRDILELADNFTSFNQRLRYAHYRPLGPVKMDPRSWWKYAYRVVVDEVKKASGMLSWEQVLRYATLRKRYVSLYASLLKSDTSRLIIDDNKEIDNLDRELDIDVIIQWRMLAHKFVEQSAESEVLLNKQKAQKSWWSFGRSGTSKDGNESRGFTKEDWERLNKIIGYKEDSEEQFPSNYDKDTLLSLFEIHMKHNASELFTDGRQCLASLSCDEMDFSIKMYTESKIFDFNLGTYRLLSPNGLLAESATAAASLVGVFSYKPLGAQLDWSFTAKASPCYITYLKDSIDEIISFFKSGTAISGTLAMETAVAVQLTLDGVRRTAQHQVNKALKDYSRFSLDLDIAAPKITIPTKFYPDNVNATNLLLDLGNLMLSTQDFWDLDSSEENDKYLQFSFVLSDVSAFLVDGNYSWKQEAFDFSGFLLPVIDRCGIVLKMEQIQVESALHPSTRLSVRLPSLGFHFSPARYHRLMQVVKMFSDEHSRSSDAVCPWRQADIEGWVSLLSWKGVGNREAIWQRRYLCLVGPFLYILESPTSRTYKHYFSLGGKQVSQIPIELTGNVNHVLAVFDPMQSNSKVVEDANNLILRFGNDQSCKTWQNRFQGAIYRVSGSTGIASFAEDSSPTGVRKTESLSGNFSNVLVEKLFVTGALDELRICFSCNDHNTQSFNEILLGIESRLFEFRAVGGQVELSIRGNDLFIGTLLRSLEIEDQFRCESASVARYLARSFIKSRGDSVKTAFSTVDFVKQSKAELRRYDSEEHFFEAADSLGDPAECFSPSQSSSPGYAGCGRSSLTIKPPSFYRVKGLLPEANSQIQNMDSIETDTLESFIKAQVIFYDQDSPFYSNIDKQVFVKLATLSFFCHRPTILAILEFANAISFVDENIKSTDDPSTAEISKSEDADTTASDIAEEPLIRGLLGKGKSRVIFYLKLSMSTAQIFLTNEDGSCLSTLLQNNLLTDIKVFPASFSIKAALGNLKISDDSLPSSHSYYWACDMRNPGGSSFVELDFSSYSSDDDDYQGYDYSLTGHLSEVRIVYLNRFVQEIVSYLVGLASGGSKDVVKLRDQVSNSEVLLTTNEIKGSPSLSLDLSLTKPIIIMPRRTDSPDYMEIDVLQVTVSNSFQWLCGDENYMNAVHLETLIVQIRDINLTVGAQDTSGESIIKDVNGLSIVIRRSLRDLLHQIPVMDMVIKVAELRASLSNREYQVITECFLSNISETPKIVPPLDFGFDHSSRGVDETRTSFTYPVSLETQESGIWTTIKVSVSVNLIELQLYSGLTREISLATVQASGAWIMYRSNSSGDSFLWSTLKGFTVTDEREGTEQEFRLAIGKNEDYSCLPFFYANDNDQPFSDPVIKGGPQQYALSAAPTMLIFDVKFRKSSTSIMLRIQRPRLLVALDFLLAITEFFAPTVRMMISDAVDKDLLYEYDAIIFDRPVYYQPLSEFSLSPKKPLIVDDERFDHYIYDGKGGNLSLKDSQGNDLYSNSTKVVIFVGNGKRLQFRNVYITNGEHLDSCILLGSNSSYSVSEVDNVILGRGGKAPMIDSTDERTQSSVAPTEEEMRNKGPPKHTDNGDSKMEYDIELQAIGPELTFYSTSSNVGESHLISSKLLRTELDMFCRLIVKGDTTEISGNFLGTRVECNGIMVLEPFDTSIKLSNVDGRVKMSIYVSDILMNFSFRILRLFFAIEEDILAFIRMTSKKLLVECSQFDKLGTIECGGQTYAFWRPRAPAGFAVLGDCLTPLNEPPSKEVLAVNTNFVKVKRPISYTLIWPPTVSSSASIDEYTSLCNDASTSSFPKSNAINRDIGCSIWFPLAPQGYVSMGCVVSVGKKEPPLSSSLCILASLVSPCSLQDCISLNVADPYALNMAFWRVDNSFGSFLAINPCTKSLYGKAYDLRQLSLQERKLSSVVPKRPDPSSMSLKPDHSGQLNRHTPLSSGRIFEAVTTFKLIWSNQGLPDRKNVSIWRPVLHDGTVYFGDIAIAGYDSPNVCCVLRDCEDDSVLKPPIDFKLVGQVKKQKKTGDICLWLPLGPPGYVSLGCIASKSSPKYGGFSSLRCIRSDMVTADQFPEESIWDTVDTNITKEHFSIWSVGNEIGTFVVRRGSRKPPKRFALKLVDPYLSNNSCNVLIDTKVKILSAAIYDDYGGLMVPLFNISLSGIGFTLQGRPDYMNSAANFSLTGRSYNDKYESWEPIIETFDGFLRYQYDLNTPGASSELRITSANPVNINISSSNVNMLLQAYSSWNNLSVVHQSHRNREPFPPFSGISILDAHNKSSCQIIPQNKLGRDIFIRATRMKGYSAIIKMPSGDNKPVKIPISNNQSDSHFEGKSSRFCQLLLSVIISCAELVAVEGLGTCHFGAVVNLFSNQPDDSVLQKQIARTCGVAAEPSSSSNLQVVIWDELCFFKVDLVEYYTLEIIVIDLGTGERLGSYSAPLLEIAYKSNPTLESCDINPVYSWRELKSVKSKEIEGDGEVETRGRIKCAVFLPLEPQIENPWKSSISSSKPGVIQISPTREGPWTTVRLNYAMPAACWRLGNNVVASELSMRNGAIYVNIRSLVSITNNTDFTFEMRLESKDCHEILDNGIESKDKDVDGSIYDTDELFEIEKYIPSIGWISSSAPTSDPTRQPIHSEFQGTSSFQLPVGWESVDDWHIDKSSASDGDGWVYAPDVEHLTWPESLSDAYNISARQRRWLRHRKYTFLGKRYLPLGLLKPGETVPLPLQTLVHPVVSYFLQLKPNTVNETQQYSWSTSRMDHYDEQVSNSTQDCPQICVSALTEYEKLLCSCQLDGNLSHHANCLWFCLCSRAKEVGKDIYSNAIHDWKILIGSPLSVTNYLPLPAEFLLLHKHSKGQFVTCSQHIVAPGEMVKFYTVDSGDPLYISIAMQGWHMIHDPVIIYHPDKLLSQTVILGSTISERVVQIMLEQSHDKDHMTARRIRAYAPCWIESDRCPPLFYTFLDISDRKGTRWISFLSSSSKSRDEIIWEISDKEMINGRTLVSAISYKNFGLSLSIESSGDKYIPAKDLSPLGDMDGSLDIYALDTNSNCIHIFVTSKPCPFLSVPTKVISIRPFMIFTNRIGQDIFLKFSDSDEPNVLSASDSRASFIYRYARESELLVRLEDTDWSFPIKVFDEDTFTMMVKKCDGGRRFLRVQIRGHEEGSRFHVIFRLGSSSGPFRIENRVNSKKIAIRQSCSDDSLWIQLDSFSTTNFSWVNPYGPRHLDICIDDEVKSFIYNVNLEDGSPRCLDLGTRGVLLDVLELGNTKVIRFIDIKRTSDEVPEDMLVDYNGTSSTNAEPLELVIELGDIGVSLIDHKPRELLYLYLKRVFISYSTGYDHKNTSRLKIIVGQLQLDNQLPLTLLPIILAPDNGTDSCHPAFKATITMCNESADGIQVYPFVYVRVMDTIWRLNIHEPIIWSLMDFYGTLYLDRLTNGSEITQVDPEIRIDLIDVSEVRLKISLETAPTQRPVGVLGIWSPILSAIGNALKIQVHLKKVEHKSRCIRKSLILPYIVDRIKRDLIHDPLHLIFSVDVLGMTKSTFASLSKGFAELSTDGQFLQLRSKQVWSRRITGVSDGILQGTQALAQGVAFGVSGVVRKPVESARQEGFSGFTHGLGRAVLGFIVQPVSGALDFVSLTVDGLSASVSRCIGLLNNKGTIQRIRKPRAIRANGVLKDYCETEAVGQMILYLAEASRHLGCTDLFKEPSKFAWSDYYENHFLIPNHRILLITNKRVMLLQSLAPDKMDKQPSKIIWDVPWEEVMALELAKAGEPSPSHLIIHLKKFGRSQSFVRLVRCTTEEEQYVEPQAVRICLAVRKIWKAHQAGMKTLTLKVPSSQRFVHFSWDENDGREPSRMRPMIRRPGELGPAYSITTTRRFTSHTVNFRKIWSSERDSHSHCTLCPKQVRDDGLIFSIWRPLCPDGYTSIGDSARLGTHPPTVAAIYRDSEGMFTSPLGYDLVWRNCPEDYMAPVSIWLPKAPEGFFSLGCVAVDGYEEPDRGSYCVSSKIAEDTLFENQVIWNAPDSYPWACYFYQVQSEALQFVALRHPKEESDWKPMRISESKIQQLLDGGGSSQNDLVKQVGNPSTS